MLLLRIVQIYELVNGLCQLWSGQTYTVMITIKWWLPGVNQKPIEEEGILQACLIVRRAWGEAPGSGWWRQGCCQAPPNCPRTATNCTLAQLRKRSSKLEPDHRMCYDISAGHRQSRWLRCASLDILLLRHRYRQSRWLYRASQDILLLRHIHSYKAKNVASTVFLAHRISTKNVRYATLPNLRQNNTNLAPVLIAMCKLHQC